MRMRLPRPTCALLTLALFACDDDDPREDPADAVVASDSGLEDRPPVPDAATPDPDALPDPDAAAPEPDAAAPEPDAGIPEPDAAIPEPDAAVPDPDAAVPDPDAAVPDPDAGPAVPNEQSPCPDDGLDPAAGTIHYVCDCGADSAPGCVAGDDNNDGLGPDRPWRTYERARAGFGAVQAGDTIAFCRGGDFTTGENRRWVNASCRAANRCVIRDYPAPWGDGEEARPVLRSAGHGFAFEDGGAPDHDEGYLLLNLDLRGGGAGWGVFFYNDVTDVLMCNLSIDGFSIGVHVGGSNPPGAANTDIALRNSQITNNHEQGWLGACDDCAIEYTRFDNNGFGRAVFNHNIYLAGGSARMRAVGNELTRAAVVDGQCEGSPLVVHGTHRDLLIAGNTVREQAAGGGCWGITVDAAYGEPESFVDVVIRDNLVIDVGNVGIGVSSCERCEIANNVIVRTTPAFQTGIAAPDRDSGPGDIAMNGVTVRNNTIVLEGGGVGVALGSEGANHVLVSNAVVHHGAGPFECFHLTPGAAGYDAVDHNLCWAPETPDFGWDVGVGDLAAWRARGFGASSLHAAPAFTDPAQLDFSPGADSPLVDAGDPARSTDLDAAGVLRDDPDIGAFER